MLFRTALAAAAACLSLGLPVSAAVVSADFQVSLDLPDFEDGAGPRTFAALGTALAPGPELDAGDQTSNPSEYGGLVNVDLSSSGLITLIGNQENLGFANYDYALITISGIVFDAGETIVGVQQLTAGLMDPAYGLGQVLPAISFGANSVSFLWDFTGSGGNADFQFGDDTSSTYQLQFRQGPAPVPLPAGLPLFVGALGGLALLRRARKAA